MSQSNSNVSFAMDLSPEVIALLQASYGRNTDAVVSRIVHRNANGKPSKPSKPSKLAAVKAAAIESAELEALNATQVTREASHDPRPAVHITELAKVGTLDARSFLIAMRRAVSREDSIQAIAGYCGYDRHADHGTQDLSARMAAQRALRGCKAAPLPIHSAAPSGKGYVSGIPNLQAKHIADLKARECLAAENLGMLLALGKGELTPEQIAHLASIYDHSPHMICQVHAELASVEARIVKQIRVELSSLNAL